MFRFGPDRHFWPMSLKLPHCFIGAVGYEEMDKEALVAHAARTGEPPLHVVEDLMDLADYHRENKD